MLTNSYATNIGQASGPRHQNVTESLIAAAASAGTTLRATKSSQLLNFSLARASTIALERAGPMCGSLSRSAAAAVFRLVLAAAGAVVALAPAPVVDGFAGTVAAGFAGCIGCEGCVPCAKAGMDSSASTAEVTRTRLVNMGSSSLGCSARPRSTIESDSEP